MRLHPWLSLALSFAVLLVVGGVVSASGPRLDGADTVAAVPNVFTFRGRLQQNGAPVNARMCAYRRSRTTIALRCSAYGVNT